MVKQNLGKITQNFRSLGPQVKRMSAQVIFSFLPFRDRGVGRSQHIMQMNIWLHTGVIARALVSTIVGHSSTNKASGREMRSTYLKEDRRIFVDFINSALN